MHLGLFVLAAGRGVGGPETYEVELASALAREPTPHTYHVYCTSPEAARAFSDAPPNLALHVLKPRTRWFAVPVSFPIALLRDRIALFHATYAPPPFSPRPYVFTHHDNSPFDHPEYYDPVILARLKPLIRRGLSKASHIICPSEFTRNRTSERFGIPLERITVIPHGVAERYCRPNRDEARHLVEQLFGIREDFFFYAGKLQGSKNTPRLLEAFARFSSIRPQGPILVLAGKRAVADIDMEDLLSRFGIRQRVRELGYVDSAHLPHLFASARALVFPSIYEGFGLPVIEAMACGTPVLTSDICALPEVAGDAALLVDPLSVDAIAAGLLRLADDGPFVVDLSARGLERARRFTWRDNARRTLEVYLNALGAHRLRHSARRV